MIMLGPRKFLASSTFSLESVDKIDRGEEATARSGADTTSCDRDRQMRLLQRFFQGALARGLSATRLPQTSPHSAKSHRTQGSLLRADQGSKFNAD